MIETDCSGKSKFFLITACLVYAGVISFWLISDMPLDDHESLVSVTSRQMLRSGDWILPKFNGEFRLQKTPLNYWFVAAAAKFTGQVDEFTSRLPSACFAFLSAAAVLYFVSQWFGIEIAALSSAIWISTLSFIKYSHNARPEMVLCSLVTIAMLSFFSGLQAQSRQRRIFYMLIFWLSFAFAMLAKGPAPLLLIMPPIFLYFVMFRQWNRIKDCLPIIGPILFLLIFLPWPILAIEKASGGLAFWKKEFIDRFMGDYASGQKPVWYYLPIVFVFAVPFSALVPYIVAAPFFSVWEKKRPTMWYLWLWFVVQIAVMSVSGGKREHYILSAFPAFSILAAVCLYDMVFELRAFNLKHVKTFFTCHFIAVLIISFGFLYWALSFKFVLMPRIFSFPKGLENDGFIWASVCMVLMIFLILILIFIFIKRNHKGTAVILFFAAVCVVQMIVIYFVLPLREDKSSKSFALEVAEIIPAQGSIIAYCEIAERIINYADRDIPEISNIDEILRRYEQGDWIIATGENYKKIITEARFSVVFYTKSAQIRGSKDVEGALFHKSGGN